MKRLLLALTLVSFVTLTQVPGITSPGGLSSASREPLSTDGGPPPQFSKIFSPDSVAVGQVSTLTFTIDNTASVSDATALDFTDNLPAGVTVAEPANASTTCTGGTLTAIAGTAVISYSGGSVPGGSLCTIQVDVVASTSGGFVNTTGDLTSSSGNSGTASDTLTVSATPTPTPTPSPTPTPTPTPSPTPTPTPSPTPTTTPSDTASPTATSSPMSTATPTTSPTPTSTPGTGLVQGNNDCDPDVDAVDALKGLQHVAAIPFGQEPDCHEVGGPLLLAALPASEPPDIFADVDCDGDVDAVDALKILQYIAAIPFTQTEPCTDIGQPF